MARTPRLSPEDALAAAVAAYGPRNAFPAVTISAATKEPACQWLTSHGIRSSVARALPLADLAAVWSDTTDTKLFALVPGLLARVSVIGMTDSALKIMVQQLVDFPDTIFKPFTSWIPKKSARHDSATSTAHLPHWWLKRNSLELAALVGSDDDAPTPTPAPEKQPMTTPPATNTNPDAAAALAAAIAGFVGGQQLDRNAVAAIVRDELQNHIVPRPVHIHINDEPRGIIPALSHRLTGKLLATVAAGLSAYIVGPAGSGKTTAAEQVAEALGFKFYLQGAAAGAHEYMGFIDARGSYNSTPFREAFEHGGVFLADEIDGSDAAALLALNAALANGVCAFPGSVHPVKKHKDFRFIAAANTFGTGANRQYVGRSQLDAATLDRFVFIEWPYDTVLERMLCTDATWLAYVQSVRAAVEKLNIRHVVSPRASIFGEKLIGAGIPLAEVAQMVIWRGLSDADVARIKAAM